MKREFVETKIENKAVGGIVLTDCYSLTGDQHARIVEGGRAPLRDALEKIREIVSKRQLPITNQVWEIANQAIADTLPKDHDRADGRGAKQG